MKHTFLICFAFAGLSAAAQTGINKKPASTAQSAPATLSQTSSNAAKAPSMPMYDPVQTLGYNRYSNLSYSNGRTMGIPRGAYGFSNGKFYLRSTDATTSGGITGSGSVGTGSSAGTMGTAGKASGVNGKSPHAAPTMWGNASGVIQPDSALRRMPK